MVADAGDGEAPFPDTWSQAAAWAFRSLEKSAAPKASSLFDPRSKSEISAKR